MRALVRLLPWIFVACASAPAAALPQDSPAPPAPQTPPAKPEPAPPAAGAKPAINDDFRKPDLDVAAWTERFEGESREIAVARDRIAASLELKPGESVADIGAGTGLFEEPFSKAVGPTGSVYAVDISPVFVEHLRQRAADSGWTQVHVVQCDDHSTGLQPASLDAAFICDTYHHFEHPAETLASLRAALKPGGRLVVVDFERIPGTSRDWILDHVRCDRATVKSEIEAAGFVSVGQTSMSQLKENYILLFAAPGATPTYAVFGGGVSGQGLGASSSTYVSSGGSDLGANSAPPADAAARLKALQDELASLKRRGPMPTEEAAHKAWMLAWNEGLDRASDAANPTFEATSWTATDVEVARAFAAYVSILPGVPSVSFVADDDAHDAAEAQRLCDWLTAWYADPKVRASFVTGFAEGPYFPQVAEGGTRMPLQQSVTIDDVELLIGDVNRKAGEDRGLMLQRVQGDKVLWTCVLDHAMARTHGLSSHPDGDWGMVLQLESPGRTAVHLDKQGKPEFYFVSP